MKVRIALAAAASGAVLAMFAVGAEAQNKPKLDANGMPCNGELDGALQCFKPEATISTLDRPYRRAGKLTVAAMAQGAVLPSAQNNFDLCGGARPMRPASQPRSGSKKQADRLFSSPISYLEI